MPDISMCYGNKCELRNECFRFKAIPSPSQSFFETPPVIGNSCEYFIPNTANSNENLQQALLKLSEEQ